ncbi:MAG: FlgD immunoglobulin-like domain containing protein, partial [Spirochaetota bacterium]
PGATVSFAEDTDLGGQLSEHTIAAGDSRVRDNVTFDFFFDTGESVEISGATENQYVARLAEELSTPWYRNVRPFSFDIRELVTQRGGVTIANNVINPERGERATLNYTLDSSQMVRIIVFNLAGDVIEIIQSGRQDAGDYSTTWDGTNRQGRPVARGIYFIRVMAGDIDEYRKVMVVKD